MRSLREGREWDSGSRQDFRLDEAWSKYMDFIFEFSIEQNIERWRSDDINLVFWDPYGGNVIVKETILYFQIEIYIWTTVGLNNNDNGLTQNWRDTPWTRRGGPRQSAVPIIVLSDKYHCSPWKVGIGTELATPLGPGLTLQSLLVSLCVTLRWR